MLETYYLDLDQYASIPKAPTEYKAERPRDADNLIYTHPNHSAECGHRLQQIKLSIKSSLVMRSLITATVDNKKDLACHPTPSD